MQFDNSKISIIETQMYNKARDIDVCIFNYLFSDNFDKINVVYALSAFQNRDGGFGHGLYIDNYNRNSSVFQCYEALRILSLCDFSYLDNFDMFNDMLKRTFNYIYNKSEINNYMFNPLVESNNKSACDSYFKYTKENIKLFSYAPTLMILAYTIDLCDISSPYYKLSLKMIDFYLKNINIDSSNNLVAYKVLYNSLKNRELFLDKLDSLLEAINKACDMFLNKDNVLELYDEYQNNSKIDDLINIKLDEIINSYKSHGLWESDKFWDNDDSASEMANIKWMGQVTINNLVLLKKFNRG